jgi:hypothetical protein
MSWSGLDLNGFHLDPFENCKLIVSDFQSVAAGRTKCMSLMFYPTLVLAHI